MRSAYGTDQKLSLRVTRTKINTKKRNRKVMEKEKRDSKKNIKETIVKGTLRWAGRACVHGKVKRSLFGVLEQKEPNSA